MSKGALWGALRILKPRRYQKWKKRPFFDLGLTYHAKKAPSRSSISFGAKKTPSFLRCISETKISMMTFRVCEDSNYIAIQAVDIDNLEGWEFLQKFRATSSGDMKKLMGCVGH